MVASNGLKTVPDVSFCFALGMHEQMEGYLIDISIIHKYDAVFYPNIRNKYFLFLAKLNLSVLFPNLNKYSVVITEYTPVSLPATSTSVCLKTKALI